MKPTSSKRENRLPPYENRQSDRGKMVFDDRRPSDLAQKMAEREKLDAASSSSSRRTSNATKPTKRSSMSTRLSLPEEGRAVLADAVPLAGQDTGVLSGMPGVDSLDQAVLAAKMRTKV